MKKIVSLLIAAIALTYWSGIVSAAKILEVPLNSSIHRSMPADISKVAIGSASIAKIIQVPDSMREFLIVAQGAGSTNLFVWTVDNKFYEYVVNVLPEEISQAKVIEDAIGLPDVHVKKIENRILLTGTVENQYEKNYVLQVAHLYIGGDAEVSLSVGTGYDLSMSTASSSSSGGSSSSTSISIGSEKVESKSRIIDLLRMRHPTQVRLEAQVIAINPKDRENLGITYGNDPSSAPGVFALGESYNSNTGTPFRNNPINWAMDRHSPINLSISALVTKNKAKILSRPSIMTMSGEEAVIKVGGQIPYTVHTNEGWSTIFKDYGIILQLKPVVDGDNKIISSVHAEVSGMSGETVDGYPILNNRSAAAVVTMTSGSTMVIGGLMDSSEQKVVNKIPLLGDIPILGEFFKYTSKTKEKQELIILVTPYLVEDTSAASRTKMSSQMEEFYKKGRLEKESMNDVDVNEKFVD